jgi:histone-arginine methyltransferase CARM1
MWAQGQAYWPCSLLRPEQRKCTPIISYAIEASGAVKWARLLIEDNLLSDIIEIVNTTVEDYSNKELERTKVDVIISEPLGNFLFNERMLESFIIARDRFLKSDGKMYPSYAEFCAAPFTDYNLYNSMTSKSESFWKFNDQYNIDLSLLCNKAIKERIRQPIISSYSPVSHIGSVEQKLVDFRTIKIKAFKEINYDFKFNITKASVLHGVGFWFNAIFAGSQRDVVLSTSPFCRCTHWYQVRLLVEKAIGLNPGQTLLAKLHLVANESQTYDISLSIELLILNVRE